MEGDSTGSTILGERGWPRGDRREREYSVTGLFLIQGPARRPGSQKGGGEKGHWKKVAASKKGWKHFNLFQKTWLCGGREQREKPNDRSYLKKQKTAGRLGRATNKIVLNWENRSGLESSVDL